MEDVKWLDDLAKEIQESLGERHISTILYGNLVDPPYSVLVIADEFTPIMVEKLAAIGGRYRDQGLEGPYLLLYEEVRGMGDSLPEELIQAVMNYVVLAGKDIFGTELIVDKEHLRAQAERTVRHYMFTLRWALINLYSSGHGALMRYSKSVLFYTVQAGTIYYRLLGSKDTLGRSDVLDMLKRDFGVEKELNTLEHLSEEGTDKEEMVAACIDVIEGVLHPILMSIDQLGRL